MGKHDYRKLGLKCGIEIHQQLATDRKLFCNCSAKMDDKEPVFRVKRKLRPVAGETGNIDAAAIYETLKDKTFTYNVYLNETCQVELDEEPPHPMNKEALDIGIQVALMTNCEVPEEIQVMRKTVLDGSNTSGFQRTAIVGMDGWIGTSFGKVGITNVCVEEDACQIMDKKVRDGTEFGLNRLGVPLVEIGTTANIPNPEEAKQVAEKIGMILRSTGRVRRGIGTIRQDVNVSIKGGARVEIKGVQDLKMIPVLIDNEIDRQMGLIKKGKEVTKDVRKALPDGKTRFLRPLPGSARMYPETDIPPIPVTRKTIIEAKKSLPELISDKSERLKKMGIDNNLADSLSKDAVKLDMFNDFSKLKNIKPAFLANFLMSYEKAVEKEGADPSKVTKEDVGRVLEALDSGKIAKGAVMGLLADAGRGRKMRIGPGGFGEYDVRRIVKDVISKNPKALETPRPEKALMGLVMKEVRGKAPGSLVMKVLMQEIKE